MHGRFRTVPNSGRAPLASHNALLPRSAPFGHDECQRRKPRCSPLPPIHKGDRSPAPLTLSVLLCYDHDPLRTKPLRQSNVPRCRPTLICPSRMPCANADPQNQGRHWGVSKRLIISLCDTVPGSTINPLSERYTVTLPPQGHACWFRNENPERCSLDTVSRT